MISQFGVTNEVMGAQATEYQGATVDHDMDPVDLFTDLGMLVLESRRPHQSTKGRIESPHCPMAKLKGSHVCSSDDPQCQEKEAVKSYIQFLYRNAIPLSIEVILYPECCFREHRRVESGATSEACWPCDQQGVSAEASSHLLEQWIIQILPKRFPEGLSEPHLLLQAVRSFLCFSQISSWLSSTHGKSPQTVVYRVCAPGESFGANFSVEPEIHTFPVINISKTSSIKVSVAYPPRQPRIPTVPCSTDHTQMHELKRMSWTARGGGRGPLDRKYGGGHHLKSDSQSSSSDEGGLDEKSGAKSKRNLKPYKPELPPRAFEEEGKYFRNQKRDLSLFQSLDDSPFSPSRRAVSPATTEQLFPEVKLPSSSPSTLHPEEDDAWWPSLKGQSLDDILGTDTDILLSDSKQHRYPFLDTSTFTPSPPLHSGKSDENPLTPSSPTSWEQSLAELEHKYSSLNLDDIPRTECSSFESDQKDVFDLSQLDGSFTSHDESFDDGIVFSADPGSYDGSDPLELHTWEPDITFNPMPLDHRIRTVSDSETCSPNVRLQEICSSPCLRNVQSSSLSPEVSGRDSLASDSQVEGSNNKDSCSRTSPSSIDPDVLFSAASESSIRKSSAGGTSKPGLLKNVLSKSTQHVSNKERDLSSKSTAVSAPKKQRKASDNSGAYIFNPCTGLPINSSPALLRKAPTTANCSSLLPSLGPMKSSPSCNDLEQPFSTLSQATRVLSTSAPAATSCLLGNFEESVLNGRLEPLGTLEGFTAEIGASGSFCPKHMTFPVTVYFFSVADEDAPSSYYGHINLEHLGRKGYRIPKTGTIQVILFNPNKTVVKMFVMRYDLSEMPPKAQTFARQRIFYMPSNADPDDESEKQLRYLLHLRFQSSSSGRIYLHTDIRMIFARHCPDLVSSLGTYELRSFTEFPTDPRFSPKK